jgi:iron(III) transport system ATP-binding protein
MIAGLELATAGQIFIGARNVTDLPATARDVAMVFQSYALFPHMTVNENVAYGLTVSGAAKRDSRERTDAALELVGLAGYGDRLPSELSGGQQQRVAVARAVVLEPEVLLFDEPLSNLDAKLRRRVREEVRELQQKLGITTVYVTHDQEEALAVSDRIIVMNEALIAQIGTPRQLYEEPTSRFVADFIGDANIVNTVIEHVENGHARVELSGLNLDLPSRDLTPGPALLAVRPRAARLSAAPNNGGAEVMVAKSAYLGSHMEYEVEGAMGVLFVIDSKVDRPLEPESKAWLTLARPGVTLIPDCE